MDSPRDAVELWAVDVSAWNCAPYTQIDARGTKPAHAEALERDVRVLLQHDTTAIDKVLRYLRGVDRVRSLVARLLPRVMLAERGASWDSLRFGEVMGRPFAAAPASCDFNITHDGDWVVMACSRTDTMRVGVDVMEVTLPTFEQSSASFCETMGQTMTARERAWVLSGASDNDILSRLLDLWTYKEAYTKNLGQGLGFPFASIELAWWAPTGPFLSVSGAAEDAYRFVEVALPRGACSASQSKHGSRIAVAVGPHAWAAPQVKAPLDAHGAAQSGLLRVCTYDELIARAYSQCTAST
mgnify:FL=1|jgi:hypothetical protein